MLADGKSMRATNAHPAAHRASPDCPMVPVTLPLITPHPPEVPRRVTASVCPEDRTGALDRQTGHVMAIPARHAPAREDGVDDRLLGRLDDGGEECEISGPSSAIASMVRTGPSGWCGMRFAACVLKIRAISPLP